MFCLIYLINFQSNMKHSKSICLIIFCFSILSCQVFGQETKPLRKFKLELGVGGVAPKVVSNQGFAPFLLNAGYRFGKNEIGLRWMAGTEIKGSCALVSCPDEPRDKFSELSLLYSRFLDWGKLKGSLYSGVSMIHYKDRRILPSIEKRSYTYLGIPVGSTIYYYFTKNIALGLGYFYMAGKEPYHGGLLSCVLFLY
jgi:hypothetical protein